MREMKLRNLYILPAALVFAACQSTAPNANVQNALPSPNVAAPAAPTVSMTENANLSSVTTANAKSNQPVASPSPVVSPTVKPPVSPTVAPKNSGATKYKNYTANGIVKGVDAEKSSIIIDHEDIGDYMVAMEMPFPVTDKNLLKNVKVGDKIEFVLETGVGVERIIKIRKK